MTGVLHWSDDGVNYYPLMGGPAGPPGDPGPPGPEGGEGVEVGDTPPVVPEVVLWVDPDDFQGESGWQGFDARYVNSSGDTVPGPLTMSAPLTTTRQPVNVEQNPGEGARYFVWGGGVLVQHFKGTDAGADQVNVLYSKPDSNFIRLGTAEAAQTEQQIQIIGNPIRLMRKDTTPFVPTAADHAATKGYVDTGIANKIATATVSATAPTSPVVGQLWAQP